MVPRELAVTELVLSATEAPGIAYPDISPNTGVCRNQAGRIAFGVCRKAMSTENTGADFAVKTGRQNNRRLNTVIRHGLSS